MIVENRHERTGILARSTFKPTIKSSNVANTRINMSIYEHKLPRLAAVMASFLPKSQVTAEVADNSHRIKPSFIGVFNAINTSQCFKFSIQQE